MRPWGNLREPTNERPDLFPARDEPGSFFGTQRLFGMNA